MRSKVALREFVQRVKVKNAEVSVSRRVGERTNIMCQTVPAVSQNLTCTVSNVCEDDTIICEVSVM